jgi:Flp pilus assembly protein TadD
VWTTVGALASTARPIRELSPTLSAHRRLVIGVAVVGGVLTVHALSQLVAMGIAAGGERDRMELAARLDPGSYRLHIALAQEWRRAGRCDRARDHAEHARDLFPNYPAPAMVLRSCRRRR